MGLRLWVRLCWLSVPSAEANTNGFTGLHMAAANLQTDTVQAPIALSFKGSLGFLGI